MAICHKKHCDKSMPDSLIESLPECQGGVGRHKCVICAYNEGLAVKNKEAKHAGIEATCPHEVPAPRDMLKGLPASQGGKGRHKCANTAYRLGLG